MSRAALVLAGLLVLVSSVQGLELKRVAISPFGPSYIESLTLTDSDHDGLGELVYHTGSTRPADPLRWEIIEYRPVNRYVLVQSDTGVWPWPCSLVTGNFYPFSAGDLDQDGKADLAGEIHILDTVNHVGKVFVCTIESSDSASHPNRLNWYALDTNTTGSGFIP